MKKISLILSLLIVLTLVTPSSRAYAADFSFSDSFSSDLNINKNLSNYKLTSGTLAAQDNSISSRIVSTLLINTSYNIGSAKLEVSESFPAGGRIVYYISNDDGSTWVAAQKGSFVNFSNFGKKARWSVAISRTSVSSASPEIHSITITVRESDSSLASSNDSRRISDLSTVANAISDFYRDYGVYPHVTNISPESRWNELMALLSRNRNSGRGSSPYLYSPVNDPLKNTDGNITYNYKDLSPNDYILAANLELSNNTGLRNDIDGSSSGINCDDPTYCIGVLRNTNGFVQNSGGLVLGASTSIYGNTTVTYYNGVAYYGGTTATSYNGLPYGSDSLSPADDLNSDIGSGVFNRGNFRVADIFTSRPVESTAPVAIVTNPPESNPKVAGAHIAKVAGVATGTTDSLVISLLLSTFVTLAYMRYTQTGIFKKRELALVIKNHSLDKDRFNFSL